MPLIQLVVVLLVIGLALWLVDQADFINEKMRRIIKAIVIVATIIWLLLYLVPMLTYGPWIGPRH